MPSHRMHLRGPWNYQVVSSAPGHDDSSAEAGTLKLPVLWQLCFGHWRGTVTWTRRFHAPTNLTSADAVSVVFTGVGGTGLVFVNDVCLGPLNSSAQPVVFPLGEILQSSNLLRVELTWDGPEMERGGLWGLVGIEVTSP